MILALTLTSLLSQAAAPTLNDQARVADGNKNPKLAVPDFQTSAGNEALAAMMAGSVATEVDRTGLFVVTTSDQVRSLLSLERQRQLLGCMDDCSGNSAAEALNVDYLLNGRLTRLTDAAKKTTTGLTLDLVIVDSKTGKRVSSREVKATTEAELVGKLEENVAALIAPLLTGRQGFLVVIASEDGSVVKVNGTQLGTTPMTQRLQVPGGPHVIRVEKEGFTAVQKQVRVTPEQVVEETIRLMPSPDFIDAYERKQWALRIGAFTALGLAVAGFATFGIMQGQARDQYGTGAVGEGDSKFLTARARLIENETEENRRNAEKVASEIQTSLAVSYVGVGLGLAAAATTVVLFLVGEDPNRYQSYRGPRATAWLTPNGGGGGFALDF
ncbi:MAG: PEGA domain-containing protein [Myxococcaceae bacterium]|nr:PEGA domain-containing protein [Myxococcaceae bacterium]